MAGTGKKNKRILLIGPLPPPIGGDTVSTSDLSESGCWEDAGITLDVIDTSPGDFIRVQGARRPPGDLIRAIRIIFSFIGKVARARAVLFWANSPFICSIGIPLMGICVLAGKPFVIKNFGAYFADKVRSLRSPRRSAVISLVRKAALVLPQTAALESRLIGELRLERSRVVRFPNFIPDSRIPGEMPVRNYSGKAVFVGQIKREKGVFDVMEAARGRDDFTVEFYGDILPRDREIFENELESNRNCSYRGSLQPQEVIDTIAEYDILLLPTYHEGEGHPAVILQAFAAGVPVITTAWRSIPELVEDGSTGILVSVRSPEEIARGIERLAGDSRLYGSIAERAFQRAKDHSESRIVGRLIGDHILKLV